MTSIIQNFNIKIFLLIIILLFAFYLFTNQYISFVQIPVYIQNYSNRQIRIYCFILTSPQYFDTRARAVNLTWAPRCDKFSFISEYSNDTKGLLIAPIPNLLSGRDHLTQKSTLALHYVYENFINDFDWFVKADDDTYLFVENLKLFLKEKNTSEPITFGYNFKVSILTNVF
jgi:glycoprotein-N-acetylgalactosamine 3-beta-galactosyltransferase